MRGGIREAELKRRRVPGNGHGLDPDARVNAVCEHCARGKESNGDQGDAPIVPFQKIPNSACGCW